MKYFKAEKMEEMTMRSYSLTKIIAFSLGILFAYATPKEERKVMGWLAVVAALVAGLYAIGELYTCTFSIGFGDGDDEDCHSETHFYYGDDDFDMEAEQA